MLKARKLNGSKAVSGGKIIWRGDKIKRCYEKAKANLVKLYGMIKAEVMVAEVKG